MGRILGRLLMLAAAGALPAGVAWSHAQYKPFSVNRYTVLAFEQDGLELSYNLTIGDLPAQRLRKRFDADADGVLSRTEAAALIGWARDQLAAGLWLALDGQPLPVEPGPPQVDLVSDQVEMFAPIWLRFELRLACPPGVHDLTLHDRSQFPELEQTELFIRTGSRSALLRATRSPTERGVLERMFWEGEKPPGPVWIRFRLAAPGERLQTSPDSEPDQSAAPVDEGLGLKAALANQRLGLWGLLAALGLAFALGAAHALSPGHGKTLVAAYLVGSRGTVRHALLLGGIVTLTHVASVVVLGLVALWASETVVPERLGPWTALAAGVLVAGMGVWMLVRRTRGQGHQHHPGHEHSPEYDDDDDHDDVYEDVYEDDHGHGHQRTPKPASVVRLGELLTLGITGGLVPCPSAAVVLLFAIYVGRIGLGLVLIGAFSLGLAASLVVIGVLVVRGRRLLERFSSGPRARKFVAALPIGSALVICALGLVMTIGAALEL